MERGRSEGEKEVGGEKRERGTEGGGGKETGRKRGKDVYISYMFACVYLYRNTFLDNMPGEKTPNQTLHGVARSPQHILKLHVETRPLLPVKSWPVML